jgi:acylphosphatase
MRPFVHRVVRLLASVLICGITIAVAAAAANAQQEAIRATVVGENIQKVGFRAMIQKQAIMYNLAGYARNNPDGTVASGCKATGAESPKRSKALQKLSSVHAQVHNHFNQERHLVTREIYKQRRSAALAEWRTVMA